jgi:hypothetical protein
VSAPIYDHSSFFDAQNSQSFQVNGQTELANNLQLEGIDDNERTGLLQVYIPPAAAIQTVDVETTNYAPEFGRAAGAVTNVVLKSGSKELHGSAYEYNEVSTTGARNYFNRTGKFPRFTNNYYGCDDRRSDLQRPDILLPVFPALCESFQRIQPVHGAHRGVSQRRPERKPDGDLRSGDRQSGWHGRQQFANNQISPAPFSPVAVKILSRVPLPNVSGAGAKNNFQENLGFDQDSTSFDVKLDQQRRAEDHLTYRYSWQRVTTFQQPAFGATGDRRAEAASKARAPIRLTTQRANMRMSSHQDF